jgi:hypothetical protein
VREQKEGSFSQRESGGKRKQREESFYQRESGGMKEQREGCLHKGGVEETEKSVLSLPQRRSWRDSGKHPAVSPHPSVGHLSVAAV